MPDLFASENYYDLVFVGRGYSVSTYLLMADLSWCKKICIISGPDAWSKTLRGEAGIINHALHVYGRTAERRSPVSEPSTRKDLVDSNNELIKEAVAKLQKKGITVDIFPGLVTRIEGKKVPVDEEAEGKTWGPQGQDPVFKIKEAKATDDTITVYQLAYDEWSNLPENTWHDVEVEAPGSIITALKVVYGGGSGPHKIPGYLTELLGDKYDADKKTITLTETPSAEGGVLGLDAFMRLSASEKAAGRRNFGKGKRLALIGPNAGLDAAIEAVDRGFELIYLFGHPMLKPFWLRTKHYGFEDRDIKDAIKYVDGTIVRYERKKFDKKYDAQSEGLIIRQNQVGGKYNITMREYIVPKKSDDTNEQTIEDLDFIVYSVGQSPDFTEIIQSSNRSMTSRIGPVEVLDPILKDKLLPIYDVNQRFGESYETALALKTPGTTKYMGLEVIGAAAFALARGHARQAYLENILDDKAFDAKTKKAAGELDEALQSTLNVNEAEAGLKKLYELKEKNHLYKSYIENLHGYLSENKNIPSVRDTMMALVAKIHHKGVVVMPEQLGGIRSQIEELTGFLEFTEGELEPINGKKKGEEWARYKEFPEITADFNGMDRTQLAVYLAHEYPDIDHEDWSSIIEKIIEGRDSKHINVYGYNKDDVGRIISHLDAINKGKSTANKFQVIRPTDL